MKKNALSILLMSMSAGLLAGCIQTETTLGSGGQGTTTGSTTGGTTTGGTTGGTPSTGAGTGGGSGSSGSTGSGVSLSVDAGVDQYVSAGSAVTLNASSGNGGVSYAWQQIAGSTVALSGGDQVQASFTAPSSNETLRFRVTVSDAAGNSSSDEVIVAVLGGGSSNSPPTASAGTDKQVASAAQVLLNGSGTDSDGAVVSYAWTQTAGESVALSNADLASASFIAPSSAQTLSFRLTVSDNEGATANDSLDVVVQAASSGNTGTGSGSGGSTGGTTGGTTGGSSGEVRAFPGAEGFGAKTTGGRGGRVIKVTNLNTSGAGSLQAALDVNEPRIIVFEVSGVINGDVLVPHGDVTIAGQTAPGAGITIAGIFSSWYRSGIDNIIVRHIRVRPDFAGGSGTAQDAMQFSLNQRMIFDHVSAAFGVDETVDMYEAKDVTVQWSTIEMSKTVGHPEGEHNYGFINGPDGRRVSLHHNLFVHHKNRSPAVANGPSEVINNVAYNVRHGFVHHNPASGQFNITGNYYRKGPSASLIPFYFDDENNGNASDLGYFLEDNYIDDSGSSCNGRVDNPWQECSQNLVLGESYRVNQAFDFTGDGSWWAPVSQQASTQAYDLVLDKAGAFPRDVVTRDSVQQVRDRNGTWGAQIPNDYMNGLTVSTAPADNDNDGMSDAWEAANGLDNSNGSDHDSVMSSGYTAIEEYINQLADSLVNP